MKTTGSLLLFLCILFGTEEITTASPAAQDRMTVSTENVQASPSVLSLRYRFGERSNRVSELQGILGSGVVVDGIYGWQTYNAHKSALVATGRSLRVLPRTPSIRKKSVAETYRIPKDKTLRCPEQEDALRAAGLKPVEVFSYIAYRESRCNPSAVNAVWKNGKIVWTLNKDGSYDSGLLQINSSWKTVTSQVCGAAKGDMSVLLDMNCNLKVAKHLLDNSDSGLGNWNIYKSR